MLADTGREATGWPLARMPFGPGIDEGEQLLAELVAAHVLKAETLARGGTVYRFVREDADQEPLPEALRAAAAKAIAHVGKRRADDLSDETHEGETASRPWQRAENGELLEVALDLLTDDEYERLREACREADELLSDIIA